MRLLADENIHAKLLPFLRSLGHDVRSVAKKTEDPDMVAEAKAELRILLTHDTDFAHTDQYPISAHAGVILIRINPVYLEKIKDALVNLFSQIPAPELPNRFFFVFEDTFAELKENDEFRLFTPPG